MKHNGLNPLKNVVIVRNAHEWQYGGAEQFAYNLGLVLKNEGIRPTVVSRVPELLAHCKRSGIRTYRNVWLENRGQRRWLLLYYLLSPVLVAQYGWIMVRNRADLLVVSSRDDQIFGTIAAILVGVPVVWFDHADMKSIVQKKSRVLRRGYFWALARAGAVVMTSRAEREKITVNLDPSLQSNFVLINNGAMVREGTALPRDPGAMVVAYAGRLDRDKGIFDLADAAVDILNKVPNVQFWLAGKGPYEGQLKAKLDELGISDHFKFLGHLDNVRDLLLAADLFVYPTHHDAAPLAPVEAMLAGVPVVASDVGGIPEMVPPEAGLLVPPKDPTKLAAAVTGLLEDPAALSRLKQGAKSAGQTRTFDYVLKHHYMPLFRRLVEEGK